MEQSVLETLTGALVVKKFASFYESRYLITVFTKASN